MITLPRIPIEDSSCPVLAQLTPPSSLWRTLPLKLPSVSATQPNAALTIPSGCSRPTLRRLAPGHTSKPFLYWALILARINIQRTIKTGQVNVESFNYLPGHEEPLYSSSIVVQTHRARPQWHTKGRSASAHESRFHLLKKYSQDPAPRHPQCASTHVRPSFGLR